MLRITMPTSFDPLLLDGLEELNDRYAGNRIRVTELFGSLPRTVLGVGRPARSLPNTGRREFAAHAQDIRERGFHLNYVFNGSCSANREYSDRDRGLLLDEMEWVRDLGVRSVVVASPYVADLFRHRLPEIRVHVSCVAFTRSLKEVAHHVRQGARRLVLDPDTVRDFHFIRAVRRGFPELEIEALANHPCLLHCPYETYCYNSVAHASAHDGGGYECFSLLRCNLDKLRDPAEFVRGSWFRPQDAHLFEDAGVDVLKLAGRGRPTGWLLQVAEAYLSRDYQGDMMELIWGAQWAAVQRSLRHPDLPALRVRAPAHRFDGLLEHFASERTPCREGCGKCQICPSFAAEGIEIDAPTKDRYVAAIDATLGRLLADPRSDDATPSDRIASLRRAIDAVDADLLVHLDRRADYVLEVGRAKRDAALPVEDRLRERSLLEALRVRVAEGPLDDGAVARIFERVVAECRLLQEVTP